MRKLYAKLNPAQLKRQITRLQQRTFKLHELYKSNSIRVLEDRKFVICDTCPPYANLSEIVQVVKPGIVMRFNQPPVKVTQLAISAPKKESKQSLEITVYFPFGEFRLKGGESAKLDAAVNSLKAADKIEIT